MNKPARRKSAARARPIKSRRDFEGASRVVKKLSSQSDRDSTAEIRLQALLRELDKFEEPLDDADEIPEDIEYSGPRRRWSDD
ncbi:MAG TPA: hypothetical protein VKD25_01265 [Burkholderiales bacterium]|nr:hypothetical protein [Burkholderiales bacterium]